MAEADLHLPNDTRLLTAAEVADLLRVPRSTVYELTRARAIPHLKVGRRILFDPSALRTWVDDRTVPPRRSRTSGAHNPAGD